MFLFLLCQYFQIAKVIIKYKIVQIGAKTQSGGLNCDLINVEYQGSFKVVVTNPPINEAEKVIIKKRENDKILFFIIIVLYITIL
tara:strand:+ start:3831 stop:4085 length:255 start_codon:yes stop_codon:yes gene_type:complete